jgi:Ca2+-binding RTX toxin-like protein
MIRPLLAAAAVLAVAAPSAAAHGGGAPDAEIFATNNTALITDQNDPRLDDRLYRFADRVEAIIGDGGGKPRGSELLDGVFFDGSSLTFERSRRFDVDRVSDGELFDIAETVRRRFLQGSVLTFDHLDRRDADVNAIELDVPHVSAKALRDGLVKDPEAAARLFGGSVTQDKHLLLVAALEDADLARSFAKRIGGDIKRARTSYGEREFVSADTDGRARIEKRTLVITGTELDDVILLREGRRLAIDFKADGVVDFEPSQRRFDRIRVEGDEGNDIVAFAGTDEADEFDLTKDRLQLVDTETVDVAGGDGEDRVTVDNHTEGPDALTITVNVDLGADGVVDRVVANGSNQSDQFSIGGFGSTVYVLGPTFVQIDGADRFDRLRANARGGDDDMNASTDLMRLTLDGGDGGGTLFGGPGDDVLLGGDGFDETTGGKGNDTVRMRGYFDRFGWRAGDGTDDVDGGASHDSVFIQGSNGAEVFDFFRFGHSVRFVHDPNAEAVDLEDIEEIGAMAFGGEDHFGVRDLAGTGVELIDVRLTQFFGGVDGDKAADRIELEATDGDDDLSVTGKKNINASTGTVTVDGLAAQLVLRATEGTLDSLAIDTLEGNDNVDSSGLEPGIIELGSTN